MSTNTMLSIADENLAAPDFPSTSIAVGFGRGNLGMVKPTSMPWRELVARLTTPVEVAIAHDAYLSLSKGERDRLKQRDPFFLPGVCRDGKRDDAHLESRSAATIDIDEQGSDVYGALALGCIDVPFAYAWHTTRSHTDTEPRLRIVVPFRRPVAPAEYRKLIPLIAAQFAATIDAASVKPAQMMFLPVQNQGAPFESGWQDRDFIDVDVLLAAPVIDTSAGAPESKRPAPALTAHDDEPGDVIEREILNNPSDETLSEIRSAALWLAKRETGYNAWETRGENLKHLGEAGFDIWLAYSTEQDDFDPDCDFRAKWDNDIKGDRSDYRSVIKAAQSVDWINPKSRAGREADYAAKIDRTDLGNANLLMQLTTGDLRHVADMKLWIFWDGAAWLPDPHGHHAKKCATRVAEHYAREAAAIERQAANTALTAGERKRIEKAAQGVRAWETQCRSRRGRENMLAEAQVQLALRAAGLDADPLLLGVANGVVDLRTGALRPAARDDLVTKRSSVEFVPGARCPRWEQFITEITAAPVSPLILPDGTIDRTTVGRYRPRPALAAYLKRMLGYALTGLTREQKLFVLTGPGSNGKSVLADVVRRIMGDYARVVASEFLMESRYQKSADTASPALASLVGARLALSGEGQDGQTFDSALIKSLTGDATKSARVPHGQLFEFTLTHKHFLLTNPRPNIAHLDAAIRGRLHLMPFDRRWNRPDDAEWDAALPDGDKELMTSLQAEEQGILAWLVAGAVEYLAVGLAAPDEVTGTTRDYFKTQDPIARWLDRYERCDVKDGTKAAALFDEFDQWCHDDHVRGARPDNSTEFAKILDRRGFESKKRRDATYWGLRVKAQETTDSELD
ncbi:DNA primase family protein [Paraburkholderia aspalathi]|uniref:DNA primase family protein n=1 Tax=Paraburkholderia aspalathi TaxID=1324617 RepID=UPI001B034707|nr:phage/plasmid primase, P4 family [Paraburkholderia aspalathi]CAE6826837.1 hypothetical protein R20943_06443 [Paraburkholderia aspalathi]